MQIQKNNTKSMAVSFPAFIPIPIIYKEDISLSDTQFILWLDLDRRRKKNYF